MAQLGAAPKTVAARRAAPADAPPAVARRRGVRRFPRGHAGIDRRPLAGSKTTDGAAGRPGHSFGPRRVAAQRRRAGSRKRGGDACAKGFPACCWLSALARHDPAAAVQMLAQEGIGVQTETSDCMIAATDKLAAAVASGASAGPALDAAHGRRPVSGQPSRRRPCRFGDRCLGHCGSRSRRGGQRVGRRPGGRHRLRKETDPPRLLPRRNSPMSGSIEGKTRKVGT